MLRIAILGAGALVMALVPAFVMTAFAAGVLWLFVYGDNVWPKTADLVILGVFFVSWFGAGAALTAALNRSPRVQRLSLGQLTAVSILMGTFAISIMLVHQWRNGNLGREPHPCKLTCEAQGFSGASWSVDASGTEDCTCHGASQRE